MKSRLCGDLEKFTAHVKSLITLPKHPRICAVCGQDSYTVCGKCEVGLHYSVRRGVGKGLYCFFDYHDERFFGLARKDCGMVGKPLNQYKMPSKRQRRQNALLVANLMEGEDDDDSEEEDQEE